MLQESATDLAVWSVRFTQTHQLAYLESTEKVLYHKHRFSIQDEVKSINKRCTLTLGTQLNPTLAPVDLPLCVVILPNLSTQLCIDAIIASSSKRYSRQESVTIEQSPLTDRHVVPTQPFLAVPSRNRPAVFRQM
jgi:hypothetical protein